MMSFNI